MKLKKLLFLLLVPLQFQKIYYVKQLPKTRSGKILRRLLRNIVLNPRLKNFGDTSTMLNYQSLNEIKKILQKNE